MMDTLRLGVFLVGGLLVSLLSFFVCVLVLFGVFLLAWLVLRVFLAPLRPPLQRTLY